MWEGVCWGMTRTHIGSWFLGLPREGRKEVLNALHTLRIYSEREGAPFWLKRAWGPLRPLLSRLEDDHSPLSHIPGDERRKAERRGHLVFGHNRTYWVPDKD